LYFFKKLRARKALKKKQIITIMLWINTLNLQFTNVFVLLFFFKPTKKPKKKLYTRAFSIIARVPRHVFFFFKRKDHMLYVLFVFFFMSSAFHWLLENQRFVFFLLKTYFQLIFFIYNASLILFMTTKKFKK
jgi:hypothetical protein